jgi:hypothetical protein
MKVNNIASITELPNVPLIVCADLRVLRRGTMCRFITVSWFITLLVGLAGCNEQKQSFQANGVTIHYAIQGEASGEPVILLHGWLGHGAGMFDIDFSKD